MSLTWRAIEYYSHVDGLRGVYRVLLKRGKGEYAVDEAIVTDKGGENEETQRLPRMGPMDLETVTETYPEFQKCLLSGKRIAKTGRK